MFEESKKPYMQKEINFPVKAWEGFVSKTGANIASESEEVALGFDGKKSFSIDGKSVTVKEFLDVLGRDRDNLYKQRPELKEIFDRLLAEEEY